MTQSDPSQAIADRLRDRTTCRGAALDIVRYMQCFDAAGNPLFTSEQIDRILRAVGDMAIQAAENGDDRALKRMLDAQLKLAAVSAKLQESKEQNGELEQLLSRLRDRGRAPTAN